MTVELAPDTGWAALAAGVLGLPPDEVERHAPSAPFIRLGGTSLRATEFAGLVERRLGRRVDMAALLGPEPLAEVVAASTPAPPRVALPPGNAATLRPVTAGQESMVLSEQLQASRQFHLLFSAEITGPLDEDRWAAALAEVTRRHESLRTVFVMERGELWARVLDTWRPRVMRPLPPPGGVVDVVEAIHSMLRAASLALLRPLEQPPVVFALTRVSDDRTIASVLIHHAITDGWSIGLLWKDLLTAYDGGGFETEAGSSALIEAAERSTLDAAKTRRADLVDAPMTIEIPSDRGRPEVFDRAGTRVSFALTAEARDGCERLARAAGLTRNAVLLAAWALVLGRRSGQADMLVGLSSASRTTPDLHTVFGLCSKIAPVRARIVAGDSVRDYLARTAEDMRHALSAGDVPLEILAGPLRAPRDLSRTSVIQFAFAAHDELVPSALSGRDLTLTIHEGHCGGTVFDALLYVQRWGAETRLSLEYATSALSPTDAMGLAGQMDTALVELAADLDGPLAEVRTVPPAARRQLERDGTGPTLDAEAGLWQLFEATCARVPGAIALRDGPDARPLTYAGLRDAVNAQAAALAAVGVGVGDNVAIAVPFSANEIISVMAAIRLGAAYVGLDPDAPPAVLAQIIGIAAPRAVLAVPSRAADIADVAPEVNLVPLVEPWTAVPPPDLAPPAPADPGRVAYVGFTSGSTGVPKGVRVPHRGVVRLIRDPMSLLPGVTERLLRFAPLAFDVSTLEIFAALTQGGCLEIMYTSHPTPDFIAQFLHERRCTGAWLTAGLFRLVARDRPEGFTGLRQLLTGGEVVSPPEARLVMETCPGLRLTNGYGPTENTTFTTVHHVDDVAAATDPLPIGRPISNTGVMVLDDEGRLLPPGAVGELCTSGDGLAVDYLAAPAETARAFLTPPDGPRYYRTGDLVRWNDDGDLMYLGRRDHQVKVRGHRVELSAVADALREHPEVVDAVVFATGPAGDRQLVAGVIAASGPDVLSPLRAHAGHRLPSYAVPVLWAVVPELPLNQNGKVDTARLLQAAHASVGRVG